MKSPNILLRQARIERGWSQRELAEQVGTTEVNVNRWEKGVTTPSPYFQKQLYEVFDKTAAELGLHAKPHYPRVVSLPRLHNPLFTGRDELLALLHERLATSHTAALTQAQALFGLGGVGKTQTAFEYAYTYSKEYTSVFWIRAATRDTLVADYVALAERLGLSKKGEQDQSRMVAAVKQWLEIHPKWLLILDNVDDLSLAQEFLPDEHNGYVLLTTRAQALGTFAESIEVDQLSVRDGTFLLLRRSKLLKSGESLDELSSGIREATERIVRAMDGLPLALDQIGAYIEETGCSLTDYLGIYATHRREHLARRSELSHLPGYPETVDTTWLISFQQVKKLSPAAADILNLCAFLAPDAIPEELFTRGAAALATLPVASVADAHKLNEALKVLRRYSLVRRNSNTHMLTIHRLVQTVLQEHMDEATQRAWAERTVRLVNAAFPDCDYGAGTNHQYYLQYYLPHVQECATLIEQYHLYFPEAAQLLYQAGAFLYACGLYTQSEALHRQALSIREKVVGTEHPTIAESLNLLAMLSRLRNDYVQAESFHLQALAIREKMLGAEHTKTAESLNNLSVLYRNQGKYENAEPLLQRALHIRKQTLGSKHHDTLITSINLAKLYLIQGKYEQAELLLRQTLTDTEQVLKPEHPLIAQNLHLLARLLYEQRKYEQAEILWQRAIEIIEKTLGSEHLALVESLNGLAELYVVQGCYEEAAFLCKRTFTISEKTLGAEHIDTLTYREHLAEIEKKRKGIG